MEHLCKNNIFDVTRMQAQVVGFQTHIYFLPNFDFHSNHAIHIFLRTMMENLKLSYNDNE